VRYLIVAEAYDKAPEDATTARELAELFLTARRTPTGD
jgi:hypothetical protein